MVDAQSTNREVVPNLPIFVLAAIIGILTLVALLPNLSQFASAQEAVFNDNVTIVKHTTPAGSQQTFNFTGPQGTFSLMDGQNVTFVLQGGGVYTFTEQVPAGWSTSPSIICSGGGATVAGSQVVFQLPGAIPVNQVCTFTNQQLANGTITIAKQTQPSGSNQTFQFTGDLGNFTLADGQNFTKSVIPGNYTIKEIEPIGWKLHGLTCGVSGEGSSLPENALDNNAASVSLILGANGTGICTFTNANMRGNITIIKETSPSTSNQTFQFTGDLGNFTLTDGQNYTQSGLLPGNYTIQELSTIGWEPVSARCEFRILSGGSSPSSLPTNNATTGTIAFQLGNRNSATCTLTNLNIRGNITIIKQTDPPGINQSFSFTGDLGNFSLTAGQNFTKTGLLPANYTIKELQPNGWVSEKMECLLREFKGGSDSHVQFNETTSVLNLSLGKTNAVFCTFNNKPTGKIIVEKDSIGGNAQFNFTTPVSLTGIPTAFNITTASGNGTITFSNLEAGGYVNITEANPAPLFRLANITCTNIQGNSLTTINPQKSVVITLDSNAVSIVKCHFIDVATISVSKNFTETNVNFGANPVNLGTPIPKDSSGNYLVTAILGKKNTISGTNPGQLYQVATIKSSGDIVKSLRMNDTLPINWNINPSTNGGSVTVLFQKSGSSTVIDITKSATITIVQATNPPSNEPNSPSAVPAKVSVNIANIPGSAAGQPLGKGDKIFVYIKIIYGLKGYTVIPAKFPITSTANANVIAFGNTNYTGTTLTANGSTNLKVSLKK